MKCFKCKSNSMIIEKDIERYWRPPERIREIYYCDECKTWFIVYWKIEKITEMQEKELEINPEEMTEEVKITAGPTPAPIDDKGFEE